MSKVEFYWILVFITLAVYNSPSVCYGPEGHEMVARIADSILSVKAKVNVYNLIDNCTDNCLKDVATWADSKGQIGIYQFTQKYHFYNAKGSPPSLCEEEAQMKCQESGCVIDAVSYYALVLANNRLPRVQKERALKYLVHFLGDIHQPLHLTEKQRGGTNTTVYFGGGIVNLHRVWDSFMIKKRISDDFKGDTEKYYQYLQEKLSSSWASEIAEWRTCKYQVHPSSADLGVCSTQWAYETSVWNCQGVWENVQGGEELSDDYYVKFLKLELPEKFLAKAGVRLALVLENIFGDKIISQERNEKGVAKALEAMQRHMELYQNEMTKQKSLRKEKKHC